MVLIRNGNGDYIDEPTIEDVLDDNFDYSIYRKNSIKNTSDDKGFTDEDIDIEQLYEALFCESSKEEIVEVKEEVKILNEYYERIRDVQWDYERDNSVNPTYTMKVIAKTYADKLSEYEMLQETREKLVNVLRNVVLKKDEIEKERFEEERRIQVLRDESLNRINMFLNREIPLGGLCLYDIDVLKKSDIYRLNRRKFDKYIRYIFSHLDPNTDYDDKMHTPIIELPKQKKGRRKH